MTRIGSGVNLRGSACATIGSAAITLLCLFPTRPNKRRRHSELTLAKSKPTRIPIRSEVAVGRRFRIPATRLPLACLSSSSSEGRRDERPVLRALKVDMAKEEEEEATGVGKAGEAEDEEREEEKGAGNKKGQADQRSV